MVLDKKIPLPEELPARVNILLVDDNADNLLALESVLADLGQNIVTARSGLEALKEVLNEEFAVILMDVHMPEMTGFETAALIRSRERSQFTPILFITAFNKSDDHVTTGYALGGIDYVFKPFQPEILKAKVTAFVELYRKARELEEEILRRTIAEREVLRLNMELERRVKQRTSQLETANKKLTREITERKRAEGEIIRHQRSIEELNRRLQRAMTETHHRVKNNLQIIAAMVEAYFLDQKHFSGTEAARKLGVHIQTLASIHELLTQEAKEDGQAHYMPVCKVLTDLMEMLGRTTGSRIIVNDMADIRLSSRQGTSLALILNELLSNALKYSSGDIGVRLYVLNGIAHLCVEDNGPGFVSGFDPVQAANTGLELVLGLSQWDLGGEVQFTNRECGGGCVIVTMPVPD